MSQKVFISYSHDTPEHSKRVRDLAWALRNHGIDVELDQFHTEEIVDWPRWCNEQLCREHSAFVICICTAEYKRRIEGQVPPAKGRGVYWEGSLLDDDIYDSKGNRRIIPVFFDDEPDTSLVRFLRGWTYCQIRKFVLTDSGYEHLLRILTGQAKVEKNGLGTTPVLPTHRAPGGSDGSWSAAFQADLSRILKYAPAELIGREHELNLLTAAWNGDLQGLAAYPVTSIKHRPKVLTFVALGGEGKTSLVAKWAAELAAQDWPGCDAAFAWSFYSQGTREQIAASSDLFLKEALTFFGDDADKAFAASPAGAFEKGQRLARIVGPRRCLLILDGLEPLQYAPASPTPGLLKDQGIAALLKGLAAASHGLCVVTTRYSLPDLRAFWQTTAPEVKLLRLSRDAGVHLLKTLGVREKSGTVQEFATLVEDVKGHALTLTLLGGFLSRAFRGDIRQRDRVKFEKADEKMDGGHAFRTMAAYEQWLLRDGGDEGWREVAVLRLMGLFDRPADAGCLAALRREPIPGLTEPLTGLDDPDWEYCLSGLEAAKLLTVNRDAAGALVSLDAHPHLREYFARQLRTQQPDGWRAAHRRLYEHLSATTQEGDQPKLEDLQPLFQAVAHACQAGLHQEALYIFQTRIEREKEEYCTRKLGAFGPCLGLLAHVFEKPWSHLSQLDLDEKEKALLFKSTAVCLWSLGRLGEAIEPMQAAVDLMSRGKNWKEAARACRNLSELELTWGKVAQARTEAERSVIYADQSEDIWQLVENYGTLADALHQAGSPAAAEQFHGAEQLWLKHHSANPTLSGLAGFQYCDLLLAAPERDAWRHFLFPDDQLPNLSHLKSCATICQRAEQALKIAESKQGRFEIALDRLTMDRAALYSVILKNCRGQWEVEISSADSPRPIAAHSAAEKMEVTVDKFRHSGTQDHLPRGLLTRAWLRFLTGARTGPRSAQEDLDEAWEIAERGPMRLFMADIHLHRARLFFCEAQYPWESPQADLAAAEKLINDCGYHRRDEELADAKAAILSR
jgi:tetratricopeptide (TPR) repeat protein